VQTLVLLGAEGDLGRRVSMLAHRDGAGGPAAIVPIEPSATDVKGVVDGADAVVQLGGSVDDAHRLLDACGSASVPRVVVLSTAMVYGAWANNPVPLTEDAALRPNPDFAPAVEAAEIERLAVEWRDDHPGSSVALLRPTVTVAEGHDSWLARGLRAAAALRSAEEEPPGQFLDLDDLAEAVDLAWRTGLDGAFNVAPDGWIAGEQVRALAGGPRVRVPARVATRLASLRWRLRLAPTPPGLLPYGAHPWVIANDRLRAAGWHAAHSNEEAFVAGHRARPLATLSPQRRQELALGASVAGLAGLAAGAAWLVRYLSGRSTRVTDTARRD
jgi:nucleoside-diphosphate-sugar epimerase